MIYTSCENFGLKSFLCYTAPIFSTTVIGQYIIILLLPRFYRSVLDCQLNTAFRICVQMRTHKI